MEQKSEARAGFRGAVVLWGDGQTLQSGHHGARSAPPSLPPAVHGQNQTGLQLPGLGQLQFMLHPGIRAVFVKT